ncbi:MAG: TolC family protein, partial [Bacteroidaceae bacterium]
MKHVLFIFLVALVQLGAFGQDSLTLDRCRSMALQHNRRLASARVQREKADHDLLATKANSLPKFDFNAIGAVNSLSGTMGMPTTQLPIYSFNAASGGYVPMLLTDGGGNVVGLSQY